MVCIRYILHERLSTSTVSQVLTKMHCFQRPIPFLTTDYFCINPRNLVTDECVYNLYFTGFYHSLSYDSNKCHIHLLNSHISAIKICITNGMLVPVQFCQYSAIIILAVY